MSLSKLQELETAPVGRLLWKYSLPAVVGTIVMSTYNIIDRIFIGQGVGTDAIAGLAITFPVMNISAALGTLIGVGASSRISIALGEKNHKLAEKILGSSLVMTIIIGILYIGGIGLMLDEILYLFGASAQTLPYAHDYMATLLPGLLVINICYSFNNMMRASGYPHKAMITMIMGAVLNVVLDPLFIFTFDMGIRGAAIASVISMAISAMFVMIHFLDKDSVIRFRRGCFGVDVPIVLSVMAIGAAPFLVNVSGSAINAIINNSLLRYGGDVAVAAAGIFTTYTQLLVMLLIGICQGLQPILGYNYGAGHLHKLRRAFWLAASVSTVVCFFGLVLGMSCPQYIAMAFTRDAGLIAATVKGLRLSLWSFVIVGFPIISTTLFQSLGMAGKSIFLSLTRQVIFIIPLLLVLPPLLKLDGVWLSFPLADLCAASVTFVMVRSLFRRLNNKTIRI